jgi:hypothetical protein
LIALNPIPASPAMSMHRFCVLLPLILLTVSPDHRSTLLTGLATASIALVTDFAELADVRFAVHFVRLAAQRYHASSTFMAVYACMPAYHHQCSWTHTSPNSLVHASVSLCCCMQLISISTLFAFLVVALALIWSRYYEPGESDCTQGLRVGVHLFLLVGASIGAAPSCHA